MFIIDVQSKDPIFEQIKKQINRFIKLGVLKPDDRLPSVRSLALELGINPNTVAKAYQELEAEGIVYTLTKKGVFIANVDISSVDKKVLMDTFTKVVNECKQNNIDKQELIDVITSIYKGCENDDRD